MPKENDEHIIIGRGNAEIDPKPKPQDDDGKHGHPLPASEKARHGSIPESIEKSRGHGAN
jgi:hypothetical protein